MKWSRGILEGMRREPDIGYGNQLEMDFALHRNPMKLFKKGLSGATTYSQTEERFE